MRQIARDTLSQCTPQVSMASFAYSNLQPFPRWHGTCNHKQRKTTYFAQGFVMAATKQMGSELTRYIPGNVASIGLSPVAMVEPTSANTVVPIVWEMGTVWGTVTSEPTKQLSIQ